MKVDGNAVDGFCGKEEELAIRDGTGGSGNSSGVRGEDDFGGNSGGG